MPDSKAEQSQLDKFKDLARELEADEDEARFEERLRQIAKNPPQPKPSDDPAR